MFKTQQERLTFLRLHKRKQAAMSGMTTYHREEISILVEFMVRKLIPDPEERDLVFDLIYGHPGGDVENLASIWAQKYPLSEPEEVFDGQQG